MTDPSLEREAAPPGASATSTPAYPGTPRWVKQFGIVALVLVLLVAGVMVASGGHHSPMRHLHLSSGAPGGPAALGHISTTAQTIQLA